MLSRVAFPPMEAPAPPSPVGFFIRQCGTSEVKGCTVTQLVRSASLLRELFTRFDTGHSCSRSFAAGFNNFNPASPVSHGPQFSGCKIATGRHLMRISSEPPTFFVSSNLNCPDCGAAMKLFGIVPASSKQSADEITFRCDRCKLNITRMSGVA